MKSRFHATAFITTFLVVMALLFLSIPVMAQSTGTIKGVVTDEKGVGLPGANILIKGTMYGAASDKDGKYVILRVPEGKHTLIVSFMGYRSVEKDVTVSKGGEVTQNFTLSQDPLMMEEVVVTGTRTPRMKLESPLAISTLSPSEIRRAAPRSTTEILRYIPGFTRVESSGGEVNQNVSVRGIFGVEFVMFMEDGMPVFPTMHTFFMNADNLFRPDENIWKVEVVRGGNSALFGSNAPGAIINFINKTGGPTIGGVLKATVGTKGLARYDFNINGPLGDNWRFNAGGFYRYDNGVRYPGFPGVRGGQLKASVTRLLGNGYIRMSAKLIDDRNQFILPLPFQNPDNPNYVDGFSDYGAMNTLEGNALRIPLPMQNGELELPLDDGIRTKALWLTNDIGFDLSNGWKIQNTAQVMQNEQSWNAILPFDVLPADVWAQGELDGLIASGAVPADAGYRLLYTNHFDALGNKLAFDTPNGLLAPGGQWHVEKPMAAFSNQFQIKKTFGNNTFSLGSYFAYYTQKNQWYFTEILTDVRDNPRFVDMVITDANGNTILDRTKNGFRRFLSLYVNGTGQTTINSLFASGEFKPSPQLRIDVGARVERNNFVQVSENRSTVDLDGDPATLYDLEDWGNRTFRQFNFDFNEWAASVGVNYSVTDNLAVYGQASRGFKMPALDEYIFPAVEQARLLKPRHTLTFETGAKYSSSNLGISLTGFWGELRDIFGQGAEVDPQTGATIWVLLSEPKTRSKGLELEISGNPTHSLNLLGNVTLIKAEFGSGADLGSWLAGVPPVIGNISGTYTVSDLTFLADLHYVGRRWVVVNENKLNAYHYLNLGVSYKIPGQAVTVSANVLNVYQSKGLEEGNPRLRQVGGRTSNLFLARPLLPRRIILSVGYNF